MTYALAVVTMLAGCVGFSGDGSRPAAQETSARPQADLSLGVQRGTTLQTFKWGLRGKIAFSSDRDGDFEIFVMRASGSHVRQLTHNRVDDTDPAWSPDGKQIAFVRRLSGNTDIVTMSSRGEDETRVTPLGWTNQDYDPTWTPTGGRITYVSGWDGATIYNMRPDGTDTDRIISEEGNLHMENPAWAPGGRRVAYTYERAVLYRAICCSGKGRRGGPYDYEGLIRKEEIDTPSWSPDGRWILFSSDRGTQGRNENHDLFIVRPGGRDLRRIDAHPSDSTGPDWGPGSRRLMFASDRRGNYDIFVMMASGSKLWLVTRSRANDIEPDWWRRPAST